MGAARRWETSASQVPRQASPTSSDGACQVWLQRIMSGETKLFLSQEWPVMHCTLQMFGLRKHP